jgi:uncharacterized caspase-like protein
MAKGDSALTKNLQAFFVAALWWAGASAAPAVHPPPFIGGIPGGAQFQAIQMQRQQVQTANYRAQMNPVARRQTRAELYHEALEELQKNPKAADVPTCPSGSVSAETLCWVSAELSPQVVAPKAKKKADKPTKAPEAERPVVARRLLAILIGNNEYRNPIPELETPVADITSMAEILRERFGFETLLLKNAGKAQIVEALNKIAAEARPEDSVLLFYAGHGYLIEESQMGFWIPVDASVKTAAGWISNTDISKLLSAIKARQLILVSDSCFSGSLTKEQKVTYSGAPKPDEVLRRRSVLVLSSGGDEPVSDEGKEGHSVFAWNLMRTLQTSNGVTPGYEVYRKVHGDVMKDYPQEPQYGAVLSAGHASGGEYLFDTKTVFNRK